MLTMFTLLAVAGGALRLALQWQMKARWGLSEPDRVYRRDFSSNYAARVTVSKLL